MVDIHSHILPGLDDGAQTIEESLEMLDIAAASGTTDIVATPHANGEFRFDPDRVQQLFQDLSRRKAASIRIHLGCDFHLTYANLLNAIENPSKYTINHHQYLMVELPDLIALTAVKSAINQLIGVGIVPIITHPERNRSLQPELRELERWTASGGRVQVTAQSLLGRFGSAAQRAAGSLMDGNYVHFIASDAHDCVDRTPDLSTAYNYVAAKYGAQRADALFIHNPGATLQGAPLLHADSSVKKAINRRPFGSNPFQTH
jgi:protein-tyrosine phosphatase